MLVKEVMNYVNNYIKKLIMFLNAINATEKVHVLRFFLKFLSLVQCVDYYMLVTTRPKGLFCKIQCKLDCVFSAKSFQRFIWAFSVFVLLVNRFMLFGIHFEIHSFTYSPR